MMQPEVVEAMFLKADRESNERYKGGFNSNYRTEESEIESLKMYRKCGFVHLVMDSSGSVVEIDEVLSRRASRDEKR